MSLPYPNMYPKNWQWITFILQDIASRSLDLKGFGFGPIWNCNSKVIPHPYIWLEPVRVSVLTNDRSIKSGYSAMESEFRLYCADKLRSDLENNVETISDVSEILLYIINELMSHPYYVKNNVSCVNDIDIEVEWEENDDIVNRAFATISLRWAFNYDCKTPIEPLVIPDDTINQYVVNGYISNYFI